MKRSFAIVLILAFSLALLAGCAQTDSAQTTSPSASSPSDAAEELVLTATELSAYNGKDGMPAYIAVDGVIYDVSDVPEWKDGEHNGFSAGNDLTNEIKTISPHGVSKLNLVPAVGRLAD